MSATAMVGVDWGSSTLRVYDLEPADPVLLGSVNSGTTRVAAADFEAVLDSTLTEVGVDRAAVVLSGMITSRDGWVQTPYAVVPVGPGDLGRYAVRRSSRGRELTFLPGVRTAAILPEVMRGEEVEILGLLAANSLNSGSLEGVEAATVILPGTHSKWVSVQHDTIADFSTFVTGQIYELLRTSSLLGSAADPASWDEASFVQGVYRGFGTGTGDLGLLNAVFSVRTTRLFGDQAQDCASYLSGVLIGDELRGATTLRGSDPVVIAGAGPLVQRYACALRAVGIALELIDRPLAALGMRTVTERGYAA